MRVSDWNSLCRLCAVFGGIYYLGKTVSNIIVKSGQVTGVVVENKKISCTHLVLPSNKVPEDIFDDKSDEETSKDVVQRAVFVIKHSILPSDKEQVRNTSDWLNDQSRAGPRLGHPEVDV